MHNGVSADGDGDGSPPALSSGSPAVCSTLILVPPFTLFSNELAMGSVGRSGAENNMRCDACCCSAGIGRPGVRTGRRRWGCWVAVLRRSRVVYRNMPARNDRRLHSSGTQGKAKQSKGKGIRRSGSAAAQMPTVWLAEPGCRVLERIVSQV